MDISFPVLETDNQSVANACREPRQKTIEFKEKATKKLFTEVADVTPIRFSCWCGRGAFAAGPPDMPPRVPKLELLRGDRLA